jgi:hypothetical protein
MVEAAEQQKELLAAHGLMDEIVTSTRGLLDQYVGRSSARGRGSPAPHRRLGEAEDGHGRDRSAGERPGRDVPLHVCRRFQPAGELGRGEQHHRAAEGGRSGGVAERRSRPPRGYPHRPWCSQAGHMMQGDLRAGPKTMNRHQPARWRFIASGVRTAPRSCPIDPRTNI